MITGQTIYFDDPLLYEHYSDVDEFGDDIVEMRAEVGLITRNVKYQGDPGTTE